jgi:glycosyltransferase involved in cell wall biosynthesis
VGIRDTTPEAAGGTIASHTLGINCDTHDSAEALLRDGTAIVDIVTMRDSQALADAVIRLLHDPSLRQRVAESTRDLVCTRFSVETMVDRYEELYQQVAAIPR